VVMSEMGWGGWLRGEAGDVGGVRGDRQVIFGDQFAGRLG